MSLPSIASALASPVGAGATPFIGDPAPGLSQHLLQCRAARGRFAAVAEWAEQVHGWLAPRFVSTITVAALMLAVGSGF